MHYEIQRSDFAGIIFVLKYEVELDNKRFRITQKQQVKPEDERSNCKLG